MPRLLMTEPEFNTTCKRIKLREDYKNALYDHLVLGKTLAETAIEYNLKPQSISRKATTFRSINPYPAGWIEKKIWLPADEMEKVIARSSELLKEAGL